MVNKDEYNKILRLSQCTINRCLYYYLTLVKLFCLFCFFYHCVVNKDYHYVCGRSTCQCRRCRCTCWHMTSSTAVRSVTSRSHGRGCCRATYARTPARSRSAARTAARRSPIAPTCALTCRHTRLSSYTRASDAESRLRWRRTSTSTTSRRVYATTGEKACLSQPAVMTTRDPAWRASGAYENGSRSLPSGLVSLCQATCNSRILWHKRRSRAGPTILQSLLNLT